MLILKPSLNVIVFQVPKAEGDLKDDVDMREEMVAEKWIWSIKKAGRETDKFGEENWWLWGGGPDKHGEGDQMNMGRGKMNLGSCPDTQWH